MLSLLETKLRELVASTATFAVRWRGDAWDDAYSIGDGNMPYDPDDARPLAAIEAELGSFRPDRMVGPASRRVQSKAEGLLRLHLSVGIQTGTAVLNAETDRFLALARKNVYYDPLTVTRIYLMDGRVDDGVAFYEAGNRTVRMVTLPWCMSWFS